MRQHTIILPVDAYVRDSNVNQYIARWNPSLIGASYTIKRFKNSLHLTIYWG